MFYDISLEYYFFFFLSRYYYMGIDIRSESTEYDNISAERIVCMGAKPKTNRVLNGT